MIGVSKLSLLTQENIEKVVNGISRINKALLSLKNIGIENERIVGLLGDEINHFKTAEKL